MSDAQIKARKVKLTPAAATKLLQGNTRNRKISGNRVEQYAADMRRGDWKFNGEAIKVAADGTILDGQHRLLAIAEAEISIEVLLITGLPHEAQESMDQGRPRTLADVLKLRGEKYWIPLATAARAVWQYETYGRLIKVSGDGAQATVAQACRTLDRNPELRDSVAYAFVRIRPWMPGTFMCALHFLFATVDPQAADDFVDKLATGADLGRTDPVRVLREQLINAHNSREPYTTREKLALTIKAWNHYIAGDETGRLQWTSGGPRREPFPQIHGLAGTDQQEAAA